MNTDNEWDGTNRRGAEKMNVKDWTAAGSFVVLCAGMFFAGGRLMEKLDANTSALNTLRIEMKERDARMDASRDLVLDLKFRVGALEARVFKEVKP
jgi:hypothetical protein